MKKLTELIQTRQRQVILGLALILASVWSGFGLIYYAHWREARPAPVVIVEAKEVSPDKYFANLDLAATAYAVYDADRSDLIAGHNEQAILSLASITKVMTALALTEATGSRRQVYIGNIDYGAGGNVGGLIPGESWQVRDLLALTLVGSSNYGAEALAQATDDSLVELMNRQAQALNLSSFAFTNTTGLDEGIEPGGQGSALDVARLFAHILKHQPELMVPTREVFIRETSLDHFEHTVVNTNKIIDRLPGILASKTGYTQIAGGNLAVAVNLGLRRPTVFVVLGSTPEGRFTDTEKLVAAAQAFYTDLNH